MTASECTAAKLGNQIDLESNSRHNRPFMTARNGTPPETPGPEQRLEADLQKLDEITAAMSERDGKLRAALRRIAQRLDSAGKPNASV